MLTVNTVVIPSTHCSPACELWTGEHVFTILSSASSEDLGMAATWRFPSNFFLNMLEAVLLVFV